MTGFLILKFFHIFFAIIAVGANITYGVWFARAAKNPQSAVVLLRGVKFIDDYMAKAALALALVTFSGTLLDQTTSQPLTGVRVNAGGPSTAHARSDAGGKFKLSNLKPGHYTITVQSRDVPEQSFDFTITRSTSKTIKACSTTLDYRCGAPPGASG